MAKRKIQRVMRTSRLTPEEVEKDTAIRRRVEQEFPPARPDNRTVSGSLSQGLRAAIQKSGRSVYQISKEANVSQIVISRFLSGERDIRMETADRLADILGLQIKAG
jgi:ribosome-binding protein aMBF1 (putative translation factor)